MSHVLEQVPLVGRADEVALLDRHLARQTPAVLVFSGEAGIGKSRLLAEAAQRAHASGWTVLAGGCHRQGGQEPYAPLLDALTEHLGRQSPVQGHLALEGCGWLVRLLPELAETARMPMPTWILPPEQERRLIFAAVGRYLANVAGPAGTLLLLDDLHWAGADALDLLGSLVRTPLSQSQSLRLVGAYRDTDVRADSPLAMLFADMAREGLVTEARLTALPNDQAAELLHNLLADDRTPAPHDEQSTARAPVEGGAWQEVLRRAEGVPFFLISCAQALREAVARGEAEGARTPIPLSVVQSVRGRLATLSEAPRKLLNMASMVGRVVPVALLVRLSGWPEADVLASLDTAWRLGLLAEAGRDYQFAHDLIREVLVADLSAARRTVLHRQVGEALEQVSARQRERDRWAAELAWHFSEGAEPSRALPYAVMAGDQAEAVFAHSEAEQQYRIAIALATELRDEASEARALEKLGRVLRITSRFDLAYDVLERSIALHRSAGDWDGVARVSEVLGAVHSRRGTPAKGIAYLQELLDPQSADRFSIHSQAALQVALAVLFQNDGRVDDALLTVDRATQLARLAEDQYLLGQALRLRGLCLLLQGNTDEGIQVLEQAIPVFIAARDYNGLPFVFNHLAYAADLQGAFERAWHYFNEALIVAEQVHDSTLVAFMLCNRGDIAFSAGRWSEAAADFEGAIALISREQTTWMTAYPFTEAGMLAFAQGRTEQATGLFDRAISLADRPGHRRLMEVLRWVTASRAERDLLEGRAVEVLAHLEPLLDQPGQQELPVVGLLVLCGWAQLQLGDLASAEEVLAAAVTRAGKHGMRPALANARRVEAMVRLAQRRWREATRALDESLALCRSMPHPWAEAKSLFVYGQLHAAEGKPEQARDNYEQARSICVRLGEGLYRPFIERALAQLDRARPHES
jgi:tetratricopeptide (TPR) repeat protein